MQKFYDTKTAIDGANIHLSMPIAKIDIEKRMVHGFATLDNVDRQQDVVPLEASIKAFEKFRGNLREQHDSKKAVGKVLSFTGKEYFDPETNSTYKGVFVSAYVSKGAQDTWEKVLDGTLTGFSIGGRILDFENKVDKETDGESVRIIKDFELMELSLVDSPANQLANILSVEKMGDKTITRGIVSNIETENVFWCANDKIAITEKTDSCECPICNSAMHNIGWVESNDLTKNEEIGRLVDSFIKVNTDENNERSGKRKNEMKKSRTIAENHPGCSGGFGVVNSDGELKGCYTSRADAEMAIAQYNAEEMQDDSRDQVVKETVTNQVTPNRNAQQGISSGISRPTKKKKIKYKKEAGDIASGDYVAFSTNGSLIKGRVDVLENTVAAVRVYKNESDNKFRPTDTVITKNISELTKIKVASKVVIKSLAADDEEHLNTLISQHNEKYGNVISKNVSFNAIRQVFERGIAAFKSNPVMNKSDEYSPEQWAYARVNGFLQAVRTGKFKNRPYDTDLLPKGHPLSTKKSDDLEENSLTLQKREGGVEMADNEVSHEELDTAEAVNEASEEVTFEVEETVEDVVTEALAMAKSDGVEAEVADDTSSDVFDMEKALGDVKSFVEEAITKSTEVNKEYLDRFSNAVIELSKAVDEKIGQLQAKYEEVTKSLADLNNAATEIASRVESVEEETAIKKSGELEYSIPEQPVVKKSLWGGRFLSSADLFN